MDIQNIVKELICSNDENARVLAEEYGIYPEKPKSAIYKFELHLTAEDIARSIKNSFNIKESLL